MPYDLIDKIIEEQKAEREGKRINTLSELKDMLSELAPNTIFQSLISLARLQKKTDLDMNLTLILLFLISMMNVSLA